jgi:hypothetical protein
MRRPSTVRRDGGVHGLVEEVEAVGSMNLIPPREAVNDGSEDRTGRFTAYSGNE